MYYYGPNNFIRDAIVFMSNSISSTDYFFSILNFNI